MGLLAFCIGAIVAYFAYVSVAANVLIKFLAAIAGFIVGFWLTVYVVELVTKST